MDPETDLTVLMASYQQGDSAAAAALVRQLSAPLHRFFLMQYISRRHADDLLQETWLRIHEVRHTYHPGLPVLPWLYAIARNVRVDHYRRAHRAESREERLEEGFDVPEASAESTAGFPDVERLMAALPESQREVIVMLKVSGMSLEEVARATSSSVGSVKQKAHRAYETLRKRPRRRPRMRDPEIDALLKRAAGAQPEVDPALVDRMAQSIGAAVAPVRPLPPVWLLTGGLVLLCVVVAVAGGLILGPKGARRMDAGEAAAIFSTVLLLIGLVSRLCVAEAIPGSPRRVAPWMLTVWACLALAGVFGLLFHDYGTERFVRQGMACLTAGLAQAVPAAVGVWWILRRGFAVNAGAAGFAQGLLAGLAGVTMLELHCPNFEVPHLIVWHIAVLPIAGAVGMLVARRGRSRPR